MASRYWVGGSSTWDATAGSKWSLTSGGTGGEAVPTSADDVYLDAASGAVTVTVSVSVDCKTLVCTGYTGNLTVAASNRINVEGSVTLASGMTTTGVAIKIGTSGTLTTAGKSLDTFIAESTVTCADALNATHLILWTPAVLALKSGVTSVFSDVAQLGGGIELTGTSGVATMSVASGSVSLSGATISYITATGGATFDASGSTDGGNNTGWNFLTTSAISFFELGAF